MSDETVTAHVDDHLSDQMEEKSRLVFNLVMCTTFWVTFNGSLYLSILILLDLIPNVELLWDKKGVRDKSDALN